MRMALYNLISRLHYVWRVTVATHLSPNATIIASYHDYTPELLLFTLTKIMCDISRYASKRAERKGKGRSP